MLSRWFLLPTIPSRPFFKDTNVDGTTRHFRYVQIIFLKKRKRQWWVNWSCRNGGGNKCEAPRERSRAVVKVNQMKRIAVVGITVGGLLNVHKLVTPLIPLIWATNASLPANCIMAGHVSARRFVDTPRHKHNGELNWNFVIIAGGWWTNNDLFAEQQCVIKAAFKTVTSGQRAVMQPAVSAISSALSPFDPSLRVHPR